jgi:phosphoribosylformylglycinamidine synthase
MVGIIEKPEHVTTQWFKDEGDVILLLGNVVSSSDTLLGLGGSAYLQVSHKIKSGVPPKTDLVVEKKLHESLLELIRGGLVKSAHDCSEGGLAVCITESCISQQIARETPRLIGAEINLTSFSVDRQDALLFGESQSRIVISVSAQNKEAVLKNLSSSGVPAQAIGVVKGDQLQIQTTKSKVCAPLAELHDAWWNAIARAMA